MTEKQRPNILWYCTDQQRFDTIGALGNPHVLTPTIDALVEGGTAFTKTYTSPICTPSRSSFMTVSIRPVLTIRGMERIVRRAPALDQQVGGGGRLLRVDREVSSSEFGLEPNRDLMTVFLPKFSHAPGMTGRKGTITRTG